MARDSTHRNRGTKTAPRRAPASKRNRGVGARSSRASAKTSAVRRGAAKKAAGRRAPSRKVGASKSRAAGTRVNRWSQRVTQASDALDLEKGVFSLNDPKAVARSLKRSAERSTRRKAEPFRSAMSMLVFFVNRAGHNLPARRRKVLEQAKDELRALYHRPRGSA